MEDVYMLKEAASVVIVAHKFMLQPDDDLISFLNSHRRQHVMHVTHSFPDAPDRKSFSKQFGSGSLLFNFESADFRKFPEPFVYLKEFYYTVLWIIKSKVVWDVYIGMDGLCTFFGLFLKKCGYVKKVVYWSVDFVPKNRFTGNVAKIKNSIYHKVNTIGYKNADEMWDLSPRMLEAREKFLSIAPDTYKSYKVVPYGVWTDQIKSYSYDQCEKHTLVFMGHLLEKQGVQFVLKFMPEILKEIPNFIFKIIGQGRYEETLKKLAQDLGVDTHCVFMRVPKDREDLLVDEIAKSAVAIAPYVKELDTWTYYADPGKVKKYLACGVPVLLTDIPWNTSEIIEAKCGLVIDINYESITKNLMYLLDPKVNQEFRNSAQNYAKRYDYTNIFNSL